MSWQEIDLVLMDMDGTLLDLNFDNHFWLEFVPARYAEKHGLTVARAKAELMPRFEALKGKLEWYCLDYWNRELRLDLAGLKAEIAGLIQTLPHVDDFLSAVNDAGQRLWLVTNAHPQALALKLERTCLQRFFDRIVCSHHYGHPKESQAFWQALHREHPFPRERALMIDDSLPVLEAARRFGIAHQIAISRPDSRQPERRIDGFPAVEDLQCLLPPGSDGGNT
ncbi:GMP/IMP nucleotidase [Methylomarinovum caldicuralii]|uniref:GMP/IMP nucleotidase n=1 Tax=Methylomarinovum caldicuralii TaxID=438856 RepID=UPI00295357D3|nr:GMP/IMP nucleotidase [Methylomarinovum caldicuralii]